MTDTDYREMISEIEALIAGYEPEKISTYNSTVRTKMHTVDAVLRIIRKYDEPEAAIPKKAVPAAPKPLYGEWKKGVIRKVIGREHGNFKKIGFGKKDYFFITSEDGGDYFAGVDEVQHMNAQQKVDYIYEGNVVEFKTAPPKQGEKGDRAVEITVRNKPRKKEERWREVFL